MQNQPNELKKAWEEFYAKAQAYMTEVETALDNRENSIDRKLAEVKLINMKAAELETKQQQFSFDKELLTKQQAALREKQLSLETMDKKLQAKAQRLQALLTES